MSCNLVSVIFLIQRRTGEIIMLPKNSAVEINHPKILTSRAGGVGGVLCDGWLFGCKVAEQHQAGSRDRAEGEMLGVT